MSVTWPERDLEAAVATTPEDGGGGGGSGGGGGGGRASHQMTELEFQATVRRSRDGKPEYKLMGLPRLDYNIMHYKTKLFIVTSLLIFEGSVAPVIFYYALTFGTDLREGISKYTPLISPPPTSSPTPPGRPSLRLLHLCPPR